LEYISAKKGAMGKLCTLFFILTLLSLPLVAVAQPSSSIQVYFFYAEDCQPCQIILQSYLPSLKTMFPSLEVKTFDVGNPVYYEGLVKLEKKYGRPGSELPVLFVGDQMLSGEQEIMDKLNPLLLDYQVKGGLPLAPVEISSLAEPSQKTFSADLVYFYQKGCPKCDRANALLKFLLKRYPRLNVKEIDLNTPDGKRLNETLANRLNLPAEKRLIAPAIFIGSHYLAPEEIILSQVEALILKYEKTDGGLVGTSGITTEETKRAEETIVERFKSFGVFAILLAGLIEGLNPCALATLIFFISYLTMSGRKRDEIFFSKQLCDSLIARFWDSQLHPTFLLFHSI
jgi:thiol-disulfide isomerase/thioredoxin